MRSWERIKYKPIPVRELLLEMKNLSEIMIDLAYSAALFNDRELAEEVIELEERVDTLAYLLDMEVMVAARSAKDAEVLVGIPKVAAATDKISDAAADIAAIVTQDIGIHPLVSRIFERVEEHLAKVVVAENSAFIGKRVCDLELAARIGADIIAVHRNKDWILRVDEMGLIQGGDVLIARGTASSIKSLKEMAEGQQRSMEA